MCEFYFCKCTTKMAADLKAEDVKNKLFNTLKSRGVLDSLKSQLRKQLIQELQDTTGLPVLHSTVKRSSAEKESDGIPLFERAANSIVAEYLKRCNFEYSLSTFLPESGTTLEKMFSSKDILHLLNIDPRSKLYVTLERSLGSETHSKGFLWHFLMEVATFQSRVKCDANIQTDHQLPTEITASLEDKLSIVDKEYREKQKLSQLDKKQGVEERLIAMQKKYELQKKNELDEEVKKFRANELAKVRIEERQKYEANIKTVRLEYDEEFKIKNQALRALEKEMLERVQRLQEVHQSEAYAERQKFLEEMRSFKEREADFKNRTLLQEKSQKLAEERLVNEVEKVKAREYGIKEKEKLLSQRFNTEVENFKCDYEKQYSSRNQELLRGESHLEAERSKLEREREKYLKCQEELATFREKCTQLQSLLEASNLLSEDMRKQKQNFEQKLSEMKDYQALKEKEIILKKDIEHLTERLTETNLHCKEQEKRHHKLVKDLTDKSSKPSKEVVLLRQELKIAQERYNEKEKSLYEERNTLAIQLESQIQRANHFQNICEEQLSTQRFLETEVENLKMMQAQTERLLSMELRQQNVSASNVSHSIRKNQVAPKNVHRRQIGRGVSLRSQGASTRRPTRSLAAEESSTMDESSLASIIEDKKSFEKFEREAAALDASYRNFQSRMTVPSKHSVASIPSSLTFRRLASYHSVHSPPPLSGTNVRLEGFDLEVQDSKDEFRPLKQVYNDLTDDSDNVRQPTSPKTHNVENQLFSVSAQKDRFNFLRQSDSHVESGRLNEDEGVALSMNDLNPVQLSPSNSYKKIILGRKNESTGLPDTKEKFETTDGHEDQIKNVLRWGETEEISKTDKLERKISSGRPVTESNGIVEAQNFSPNLYDSVDATLIQADKHVTESNFTSQDAGDQGLSGKLSESSVSKVSNTTRGLDYDARQHSKVELTGEVDEGRLSQKSSTSSDKSLRNSSLHDNSPTYAKIDSNSGKKDDSRNMGKHIDADTKNTDRRHHSTELDMFEIEEQRRRDAQDILAEADNKDTNLTKASRSVGSESDGTSGRNGLISDRDSNAIEGNDEDDEQDPPIDPVMLKYMEMIKQRREAENKKIEEQTVDIASKPDSHLTSVSDQESRVSVGKDDDVSMGKMSDDDFDW